MADLTEHRAYPLPDPAGTLDVDVITLRDLASAVDLDIHTLLAATATGNTGAADVAFEYDGAGRITTITTTLASADTITQVITYNGDGTVAATATTHQGITRTDAYTYAAGRITTITTTETATP